MWHKRSIVSVLFITILMLLLLGNGCIGVCFFFFYKLQLPIRAPSGTGLIKPHQIPSFLCHMKGTQAHMWSLQMLLRFQIRARRIQKMIFCNLNILPYVKNHYSSKSSHIIIRATPPFLRWIVVWRIHLLSHFLGLGIKLKVGQFLI